MVPYKMMGKITPYTSVREEKVSEKLAEKTWIRWLIRKEEGAPLFAMRVFRVEPGGHIKAHRHPWEHEIFIISGEGEIRIGSQKRRVEKGYFVFIPPCIEHEYWNRGTQDLEFICVIPHELTTDEKC
jgi:quercetin dioxygenase-like cupin family protein